MEQQQPASSRKNFVLWGLGILGAVATRMLKPRTSPRETRNMIKMLSQDGKLVEVDASKIYCGKRQKITDEQLKNWVAKK